MYRALYRQFRPQTFDQVVGQSHIVDTIKNQIINKNIGHGYLFSGTRGTGKTSTAKILSRAVNCLDLQDGNPCNKCENCLSILDGTSIDVIEMDAASNRGVNDIRELRDKIEYPPSKGKKKVYIIDEVHMLTTEAFNALLKTLEEPPAHILFILATTEPERLPDTILSRLQRYDFKRITTDEIVNSLRNISDDLDIQVEEEALWLIGKTADGSMRDALSIMDTGISFSQDKLTYEEVADLLGAVNKDVIFKFVEDILREDANSALLIIDDMLKEGRDVNQFIIDIIDHYRDLMIVKSGADISKLVQVNQETLLEYQTQAEKLDLDYIVNVLDELTKIDEDLRYSTNPRILLEMAIIRAINIENISLKKRVEKLEKALESGIDLEIKSHNKTDRKLNETAPENKLEKDSDTGDYPFEDFDYEEDEYFDINQLEKTSSRVKTQDIIDTRETENLEAGELKRKENIDNEVLDDNSHTIPDKASEDELVENPSEIKQDQLTLEELKASWADLLENIRLDKPNVHGVFREGDVEGILNEKIQLKYKPDYEFHMNAAKNHIDYIKEKLKEVYNRDLDIDFQIESDDKLGKAELIKKVTDVFGEDKVNIKE